MNGDVHEITTLFFHSKRKSDFGKEDGVLLLCNRYRLLVILVLIGSISIMVINVTYVSFFHLVKRDVRAEIA